MRDLPASVERAIEQAIRLGPGTDAPPLVQLAWIYGEGGRIVTRAADEALRRRSFLDRLLRRWR